MPNLFKNFRLFYLMLIMVFSAMFMVACSGNGETKTETTDTEIKQSDSLPALDTDSLSSTRPESLKNQ